MMLLRWIDMKLAVFTPSLPVECRAAAVAVGRGVMLPKESMKNIIGPALSAHSL